MYFAIILDADLILSRIVFDEGEGLAKGLKLKELIEKSNRIFDFVAGSEEESADGVEEGCFGEVVLNERVTGEILIQPNLALALVIEGDHAGSEAEGTDLIADSFESDDGFLQQV